MITRNRANVIQAALETVKLLDYPRQEFELIVVDNGSSDDTPGSVRKIMEGSGIAWKIIKEPVAGICRARNSGVVHAQGEWVLFLDDDALVAESWLNAYRDAIWRYPEAVAFGGSAKLDINIPRPWWWIDEFDKTMSCQNYGSNYFVYPAKTNPYGLNMLIKRSCLQQVNGFDIRLDTLTNSFGDETELFIRLRKNGKQIVYVPDAGVIHSVMPDRLEWKNFMKRFLLVGRSHACLDYLHDTWHARSLLRRMMSALVMFIRHGSPAVFLVELYTWRGYRHFKSHVMLSEKS